MKNWNKKYEPTTIALGIWLLLTAISFFLSVNYEWDIKVVLTCVYIGILLCTFIILGLAYLTAPFAIRLKQILSTLKYSFYSILILVIIILGTATLKYIYYNEHPEYFTITEEVEKGGRDILQREYEEKVKLISIENLNYRNDLFLLESVLLKLKRNKTQYDKIMNGSKILPIDSVIIFIDRILGLPPGSKAAFSIRVFDANTYILVNSITVEGYDYITSINHYIVKINKELTKNDSLANELRHDLKIGYHRFVNYVLGGHVTSQVAGFYTLDVYINRPIIWLLIFLSGFVYDLKQKDS